MTVTARCGKSRSLGLLNLAAGQHIADSDFQDGGFGEVKRCGEWGVLGANVLGKRSPSCNKK